MEINKDNIPFNSTSDKTNKFLSQSDEICKLVIQQYALLQYDRLATFIYKLLEKID